MVSGLPSVGSTGKITPKTPRCLLRLSQGWDLLTSVDKVCLRRPRGRAVGCCLKRNQVQLRGWEDLLALDGWRER